MQRKRFHRGRTSAKPFGRFSSFCGKHNRSFPTYDFCRDCERERYLRSPEPEPTREPSGAEKERLARIRALADAMAVSPSDKSGDQ